MVPKSPNKRKVYFERQIRKTLADTTPRFTAHDQYMNQIGESVKKIFRVKKTWTEQPQRVPELIVELRRVYPNILNDWAIEIEEASLEFAHAFFSCHRKYYLRRQLRQASRSEGVDRSAVTANVDVPVAAGTRSRRRQAQEPIEEQNSPENPIDVDNPPVLKRPPNLYQNPTRPARPADTADPQTSTRVGSNERIKRGTESEVKLFLENCKPSMAHHFDSFIRAGVKNGEYLKAVGRLCASNTDVLSSILGPNSSVIDSILLQAHLLTWSKEVIQYGGRSAQN